MGVTAAFGATAIYPLYVAERKPRPTTAPPVRECRRGKTLDLVLFVFFFLFFLFVSAPLSHMLS